MVSLEYGPGRASTEPKRLGLLVECEESLGTSSPSSLILRACRVFTVVGPRSLWPVAAARMLIVDDASCLFPLAGAPATTNIIAEPPRL